MHNEQVVSIDWSKTKVFCMLLCVRRSLPTTNHQSDHSNDVLSLLWIGLFIRVWKVYSGFFADSLTIDSGRRKKKK